MCSRCEQYYDKFSVVRAVGGMRYNDPKPGVVTSTVIWGMSGFTIRRPIALMTDKFGVVGAVVLSASTSRDDTGNSSIA